MTSFYNRDGVYLLRGTYWVFKYNSDLNKNLSSAHTVYLCVLCGYENKQQLFPYTALTDWFFYGRDGVCLLRGTDWMYVKFMPVFVFNGLSNARYRL